MGSVSFGDVLFIVLVCGVIYAIVALVNRGRR